MALHGSSGGRFNPAIAAIQALQSSRQFNPASISTLYQNTGQPASAIFQGDASRGAGLDNALIQSQILKNKSGVITSRDSGQLARDQLDLDESQGNESNRINKIRAMAEMVRAKSGVENPATENTLRAVLGDELYEQTKGDRFSVDDAIGLKRSANVGRDIGQRQDRLTFDIERSDDIRDEKDRRQDLRELESDRKLSALALKIDDLMRDNKMDPQTAQTLKDLMGQSAEIRGGAASLDVTPPTPEERVAIEGEAMQLIEADPQYDDASESEKRRAARPIAVELFKQSRAGR